MKVVVLRPEPGAAATARRARAAGLDAMVAPLFVVRPVGWSAPVEPFDAVMLTSANALRHAGPALAAYRALPVWAVGTATAAAARAAGFADVRVGQGDAAALVATIPADVRVLHLAGREHRAPLPPGGIRRVVYAADAIEALPDAAASALAEGAVALLHSPRAAALFATLAEDRGRTRLAALSPAVAAAAGGGWAGVRVAARPDDAALIAAVCAAGDWG